MNQIGKNGGGPKGGEDGEGVQPKGVTSSLQSARAQIWEDAVAATVLVLPPVLPVLLLLLLLLLLSSSSPAVVRWVDRH